MKAGKYWVGDLCYVLADRWEEVCELTIKDNRCLYGEFTLKDGTEFAIHCTAWGDGEYPDGNGNTYLVDSGSIGCVLVSSIENADESCGNIHEFEEDFTTSYDNGTINIGHVSIETMDEYFEEEEEEEW